MPLIADAPAYTANTMNRKPMTSFHSTRRGRTTPGITWLTNLLTIPAMEMHLHPNKRLASDRIDVSYEHYRCARSSRRRRQAHPEVGLADCCHRRGTGGGVHSDPRRTGPNRTVGSGHHRRDGRPVGSRGDEQCCDHAADDGADDV